MWSYVLVPLNPVAMDFRVLEFHLWYVYHHAEFSFLCTSALMCCCFFFFFLFVEEEEVVTPLLRAINLKRDLF